MIKFFIIYFLLIFNAYALKNGGTNVHNEQEYRQAYKMTGKMNGKVIKDVQLFLKRLINHPKMKFNKIMKEDYFLEGNFNSFLFKDYYFDTKDSKILKNNMVYRLRYRWKNASDYYKYKWLPLKTYEPSRCEIQFKYDYNLEELSEVQESRFEFRNDSFPFNKNKDAPPAPWKYDEYKKYVTSGKYKNYHIIPSLMLRKKIKGLKLNELENVITTETIRVRNHINIKTVFGDPPNPEQAMIITFDFVYPSKGDPFIELEMELDRSIGRNMNNIIFDPDRSLMIKQEIYRIKSKLLYDINFIFHNINLYLKKQLKLEPLKKEFKYKRISDNLN